MAPMMLLARDGSQHIGLITCLSGAEDMTNSVTPSPLDKRLANVQIRSIANFWQYRSRDSVPSQDDGLIYAPLPTP